MDRPDRASELLRGTRLTERAATALTVPLARAMDATLVDPDDPPRGILVKAQDVTLNGVGAMHASALAAAMETAAYLALLPHLTVHEHAVTHSLSLHLVRAVPEGSHVLVRADTDRRTRRLAFLTAHAVVGDRVAARAQLVKSVVSGEPR